MDILGALIGFAVVAFAGCGALLGWLAFARLGRLERRLVALERARATAASSASHSSATPTSTAESPTAPVVSSAPPTATSDPLSAVLRPDPAPTSPAVTPFGSGAAEPASAPQLTAPRAVPGATPPPIPVAASVARPREPAPATPLEHAQPARHATKPFDLERWLGVRGAAVLGGVFLAIAAFLFLQLSIERGWVTPKARVLTATLAGIACFLGSARLRRREYTITANSLAGAGAVILYAASWAASMLYGFVSPLVSFAAMGAVTAACIFVSWRHRTQVVAVLGLVGGFATPLVLSTGQDRPFGLFGYVLLLDLAFLFLAGRRRWPAIGIVALIGTTLIQGLWIFVKMDPEESWIGLTILGLFALTFAGFATLRPAAERKGWIPAQTGAVFLPFAFVLYFAQSLSLSIPLGALALLAALLCAAAGVLARRDAAPWLPVGAAAGSAALIFTWTVSRPADLDASTSWLVAGCALGITALQHAFAEWRRRDGTIGGGTVAGAATSAISTLLLAVFVTIDAVSPQPWPWIACVAAVALVLQRQAALGERLELALVGAVGAGAAFALQRIASLGSLSFDRDVAILATVAGVGTLLLAAAHLRRAPRESGPPIRAGAFAAAASFFLPAMFAAWSADIQRGAFSPTHVLALGFTFLLAIGALVGATGAHAGLLFVAAVLPAYLMQTAHAVDADAIAASTQWATYVGLLAATTVLFAIWPLATRASWRDSALAWCTAALQPLLWVFPVAALVEARIGRSLDFATPLAFALVTALVARALWRTDGETEDGPRRVQKISRVTATLTALLLASSVVPVQIDRESGALTLALFGAAAAYFWTRVDSRAIKWTALAATVFALGQLALFSEPWSFEVPPRAILNWNLWIYLVPGACAVFVATRLRAHELERLRGFERGLPGQTRPISAGLAGIAAVVLVFVWLNVEIAALFAIGDRVGPRIAHEPGRALASSLGWAVYALVLLAIGVTRKSGGPRWASLVLFFTTIGKVFLFDLGHLAGLQRVASMLGLALSLIVVSLVYQRFVFRRTRNAGDVDPSRAT